MVRIGVGAVLMVALWGGPAFGQFDPNLLPGWEDDVVTEIQVSGMEAVFDPNYGDLGTMDIHPKATGLTVTVVYENEGNWTMPLHLGGTGIVNMLMNLYSDASSGGEALGHFNGDNVGDPDWELGWDNILGQGFDVTFLEGTLIYYRLQEYMDTGMLAGGGRINATGGYLLGAAGWPSGTTSITSFEFAVYDPTSGDPLNISDFTQPFTGDIYLTFYDDDEHGVPEPTTLALLAGGIVFGIRRRRS